MVTLVEIGEGQGGGLEERCWRGTGRVKKIVKRSVKIAAGVGRVAPMTFLRGIMRMRGDV